MDSSTFHKDLCAGLRTLRRRHHPRGLARRYLDVLQAAMDGNLLVAKPLTSMSASERARHYPENPKITDKMLEADLSGAITFCPDPPHELLLSVTIGNDHRLCTLAHESLHAARAFMPTVDPDLRAWVLDKLGPADELTVTVREEMAAFYIECLVNPDKKKRSSPLTYARRKMIAASETYCDVTRDHLLHVTDADCRAVIVAGLDRMKLAVLRV